MRRGLRPGHSTNAKSQGVIIVKCEIEFLPVGDGSRAGDAIVVRYGEPDKYSLMLVDGGTEETGEDIVNHIKKQFGEEAFFEHVVVTHSDADHASGIRTVLSEIPVNNIWLHIPWLLAPEAIHLFKNKQWTAAGLSAAIRKEYEIISEIVDLAVEAGTNIAAPFQGTSIGPFVVLSPRRATYLHLLPQFDKTPEPDQQLLEQAQIWIGKPSSGALAKLLEKAGKKIEKWIKETWASERLKDGGVTSASNESSVILYCQFDNAPKLLTGDAGINALNWAMNFAKANEYPLQQFSFVQIPHHGSRRNVGPTVLNELLGPIQPEGTERFYAFVSAPKDDENHPRKIVLNAFMRRGGMVVATQGIGKVHWGGFPPRPGYTKAEIVKFSDTVEDYD